jgi:hypothetical protein
VLDEERNVRHVQQPDLVPEGGALDALELADASAIGGCPSSPADCRTASLRRRRSAISPRACGLYGSGT